MVFLRFSYGFLRFETSGKPEENRKKTGRKPEENRKKTKRKPKENQKKTEENRRKPEEKKTTAPPVEILYKQSGYCTFRIKQRPNRTPRY